MNKINIDINQVKMSDKPKRTLTEEQKEKMQAAAKTARDKRKAEEDANPALREERLAKSKAKREAKKGSQKKEEEKSNDEDDSADSSATPPKDQPKKERKKLSPEAQAAAIAKRKATIAAKKAFEEGHLDNDVPEDATAEDIKAAVDLSKKVKAKKND
jgi:hypothetical protein